jgi:hypothetical protein
MILKIAEIDDDIQLNKMTIIKNNILTYFIIDLRVQLLQAAHHVLGLD